MQETDGIFLSMHEDDDSLEYRAVDSAGEVLWTAQRPRACSTYLVTATADGPIAVLMDQDTLTGTSLTPTAGGYDLATGEQRWGPVETPGALLGNGLVFAGAPKDFIGASGPRTALDPATGDVVAADADDESESQGEGEGDETSSRVVALFGEHLVRSQGGTIIGEDLTGNRLWTRAATDFGMSASGVREVPWEPIGDTHALVGEAGDQTRTLIDLRSGITVDAEIADAWFDAWGHTLVTAGSELRGFDVGGAKRWSSPLPENAEVATVGAGLIVVDSESGTGSEAESGSDHTEQPVTAISTQDGGRDESGTPLLTTSQRLGTPHHISESGAALFGDPQTPLLVTSRN